MTEEQPGPPRCPGWHLVQGPDRDASRAERDGLVARHLDGARVETATPYELIDLGLPGSDSQTAPIAGALCSWPSGRLAAGGSQA